MDQDRYVLIVEDDEVISGLLRELLESERCQVQCAQNGAEALALLRSQRRFPGLILLDLMMPVMDGFEFMNEKQKDIALSKIPVIVMSADSQLKDKLSTAMIQGYFKKPVKIDVLMEAVDRHYQNL